MDLISTQMLKEGHKKLKVLFTYILNAILRLNYILQQWATTKVIMIPKPDNPLKDPNSYRPISLLPIISKVFEKLYLRRLIKIVAEKQIIQDYQFGFRPKHLTVEQVHKVATTIL